MLEEGKEFQQDGVSDQDRPPFTNNPDFHKPTEALVIAGLLVRLPAANGANISRLFTSVLQFH